MKTRACVKYFLHGCREILDRTSSWENKTYNPIQQLYQYLEKKLYSFFHLLTVCDTEKKSMKRKILRKLGTASQKYQLSLLN